MSINEQHAATERARKHRQSAEDLLQGAFTDTKRPWPADVQIAAGMAAIIHLLLAMEDRLAYGEESILSGTVSCRTCRAILLDENAEAHYVWHRQG